MLGSMLRVLLAAAVGGGCGLSLCPAAGLVAFVAASSFEPGRQLSILMLSVGAVVGGTFGFLTRRDPTRMNRQDPPGLHRPPEVPL